MAGKLSRKLNKIVKQKMDSAKTSTKVKTIAFNMISDRVENARKLLEKEFNDHEITDSIENNTPSSSLGYKASFFEYLGFKRSAKPTKILREAFSPKFITVSRSSTIVKRTGKNVKYSFLARYPSMEEIYQVTNVSILGRSWVKAVQKGGIGDLSITLAQFEEGSFNNSRSGTSIQVRNTVRSISYRPQGYVNKMLERFRARIAGRDLKGRFL